MFVSVFDCTYIDFQYFLKKLFIAKIKMTKLTNIPTVCGGPKQHDIVVEMPSVVIVAS